MRTTVAALSMGALLLGLGCGSPCQDLANRICNCEPEGVRREDCKSSVGNQIGNASQRPGPADQEFCESKLETCPDPEEQPEQCDRLRTPAGKEACGLSYPADTAG